MKFVVLQGDGMADEPIAELGGKTPLDAAQTPNLDRMARAGILGLTRTIPPGLPPGSDVGTMSVLGYDPTRYHTGRSPIEAASMGVELGSEDVAFRCNLVTLETPEGGVEVMRDFAAGHIPTAEAREIVEDLNRTLGGDGLEFHPGVSYRHLLVWRGGEHRMRTTPPHDLSDKPVGGAFPQGSGAAVLSGLLPGRGRPLPAQQGTLLPGPAIARPGSTVSRGTSRPAAAHWARTMSCRLCATTLMSAGSSSGT